MRDCVFAIAGSTYREAVRDRVLWVVFVFAAGLVLFSRVLGWLSVEDDLKMLQDFSLSGLNMLGLSLAMLVGAFSLAREVERRTATTILTRDISRGEFILGKYLGLVGVFWSCLIAGFVVMMTWQILWGGGFAVKALAALLGLLCESLLLGAVALFFGALTNAILAAVGTVVFYLMAHSLEALYELTIYGDEVRGAWFYKMAYKVLPNLEDVNFINATASELPVRWDHLGMGALGVLCWSIVFLLGASALFRRREL